MLRNMTIRSRLAFVMGILCLALVGLGGFGLISLQQTNGSLRSLYEDRVLPMNRLNELVKSMNVTRLAVAESMDASM
ncbi:MAG TPA: Tar ligand binding domain-containing protein, partial [Noviherbaspirillum sp.]